eukprot:748950-Hanusia_phi.AAC.1
MDGLRGTGRRRRPFLLQQSRNLIGVMFIVEAPGRGGRRERKGGGEAWCLAVVSKRPGSVNYIILRLVDLELIARLE